MLIKLCQFAVVLSSLICCINLLEATASEQSPLVRDFVGLNGHYEFKPKLYQPTCRLVRNYHNFSWDVVKPGDPLTFPKCVNKVNWDRGVYGKWKKHGFETDLCAMFGSFGERNKDYKELWKGQEEWIEEYGYEMAKYFGPSGVHKLVTSIEIGNEPGNDFDDALYQNLFTHMARGIRKGDPKIKIVTATAHAREADKYSKSLKETFASKTVQPLYDVINLHVYAIKPKKKNQSPWDRSYPEDPQLDYLKIVDETIAWRDRHAPEKEVWITEFGYDACTPAAMKKRTGWFEKLNWQGVTELQQAQYNVRSLFCFAERDIERAYLYFYNDSDKASVHAASGLTRNFQPKPAYWAVKHYYETLGEYRFSRAVKTGRKLRVHEYTHGVNSQKVIWVAWLPTGSGQEREIVLKDAPGKLLRAEQMPTTKGPAPKVDVLPRDESSIKVFVSESPTYLIFDEE